MKTISEFYNEVAKNEKLQNEFTAAAAEGKAAIFTFAQKYGCDATKEEIVAFFENQNAAGELSDEDLDAVAGGKVDVGMVFASIFTAGIVCGMVSAYNAGIGGDCEGAFHK